jgi:SAM-dependent methyltransferase
VLKDTNSPEDIRLESIYRKRFEPNAEHRRAVWGVLVSSFFSRFIAPDFTVLDLGCGYGEFINTVQAKTRLAIDMNPTAKDKLAGDIKFFLQDSSEPWQGIQENSIDVVFTSNFLEHLPDKAAVARTLREINRCLKPGCRLIAMGPNAKYLGGLYWDFWDHQLPFTENSLAEGLLAMGFSVDICKGRFLPYTMSSGRRYPPAIIKLYLALPFLWRLFGRQFLVVARKI